MVFCISGTRGLDSSTGRVKDEGFSEKDARKRERQKATDNGSAKRMTNFMLIIHSYNFVNGLEQFLQQIDGVDSVKGDGNFKLEVKGKVDPSKVREMVQSKTKEKVEIIIPSAEGGGGRNEKKVIEGKLKKQVMPITENDTTNEKDEVRIITLKIKLCCDYCNQRLKELLKNKGLEMIDMNIGEDLVEVRGTVDMTELRSCIKDKLNRDIEVVDSKEVVFSTTDKGVTIKEGKGKGDGGKKEEDGAPMKKLMQSEVAVKIKCGCDGCIKETRKIISKFEGVKEKSHIAEKEILVSGTMDVHELTSYLKKKAKNYVVEVIPRKRKIRRKTKDKV